MLTYEEIINYNLKYKVINKEIYRKIDNKKLQNEDLILKIKTAMLIYKQAQTTFEEDKKQFGKPLKTQKEYIEITMKKFSINKEKNDYGINKLINSIINSNGHYEEMMSGKNLKESKFSILLEPKKDYTLAYLKLKYRQQGKDIEEINITQDLSELEKNGISKVIIDFQIKEYKKKSNNTEKNKNLKNIIEDIKKTYIEIRNDKLENEEKRKKMYALIIKTTELKKYTNNKKEEEIVNSIINMLKEDQEKIEQKQNKNK